MRFSVCVNQVYTQVFINESKVNFSFSYDSLIES